MTKCQGHWQRDASLSDVDLVEPFLSVDSKIHTRYIYLKTAARKRRICC